ncbi:MAG: hypothetical protein ACYDD1_16215 [Caulobacteraceae bacterium]
MGTITGWLCALAGVLALRLAWRRRPIPSPWTATGWGLMIIGLFGWAATTGEDVAVALALLIPSLAGYGALAAGARVRGGKPSRSGRSDVELEAGPSDPWRAILRTLYVGPLAALAAFSAGAAVALKGPGSEATRLIAGGMLIPVLWAAGMIWATTDRRLTRVGLGLVAGSLASLAAAVA